MIYILCKEVNLYSTDLLQQSLSLQSFYVHIEKLGAYCFTGVHLSFFLFVCLPV